MRRETEQIPVSRQFVLQERATYTFIKRIGEQKNHTNTEQRGKESSEKTDDKECQCKHSFERSRQTASISDKHKFRR